MEQEEEEEENKVLESCVCPLVFRAADPGPEYGVKEQPQGTKVTLARTKAQLMGQDSSGTMSSPESMAVLGTASIGITSSMGAMSNTGIMASNHYYQLSTLPVPIMASTHHDKHPPRSTPITASSSAARDHPGRACACWPCWVYQVYRGRQNDLSVQSIMTLVPKH